MQSYISTQGARSSERAPEEDRFKVEPLRTEQEMEERLEAQRIQELTRIQ